MRLSERLAVGYFCYLSALAAIVGDRPRADWHVWAVTAAAWGSVLFLIYGEKHWSRAGFSVARDWWTLALLLAAYRSLNLFAPDTFSLHLEKGWLRFDMLLLEKWRLRNAIEALGSVIPAYLEACYLLTSQAGCYALAVFYILKKRERADCFLVYYLMGTMISYVLIPFIPSLPPRIAFPGDAAPQVVTEIRNFNLFVLSKAGIHTGVMPSAHVSSTFAAAAGMFYCLRERPVFAYIFLIYAISVAFATVYGRYHYALDAAAGIAVSLLAAALSRMVLRKFTLRSQTSLP